MCANDFCTSTTHPHTIKEKSCSNRSIYQHAGNVVLIELQNKRSMCKSSKDAILQENVYMRNTEDKGRFLQTLISLLERITQLVLLIEMRS